MRYQIILIQKIYIIYLNNNKLSNELSNELKYKYNDITAYNKYKCISKNPEYHKIIEILKTILLTIPLKLKSNIDEIKQHIR